MIEIENTQRIFKFSIIPLISIIIGSIIIRLFYFVGDIPITYDGLLYLLYAKTTSELGHLPTNYSLDNNGWAIFLSGFFSLFSLNSAIDYMNIQKIISISLSSLTLIPIYFLMKKFVDSKYIFVGLIFFAFEPRLIQNSLLGITEPLYILLLTLSLTLFLSNDKKIIYLSMAIVALSTIVRSEGLFLFIVFSLMFVIRFRKDKLVIPKYLPAIAIFLLILFPMISYQTEIHGNDRVFDRVTNGLQTVSNSYFDFAITGIENYVKFLIWDLIPIFILFAPIGFFLLLKNLNFRSGTIIIYSIIMSLPALFAYGIPVLDTRYLFFMYPGFCIMSVLTIHKIADKSKFRNYIILTIVLAMVISSVVFLEYQKIDYEHEKELIQVAEFVVKNTDGVNAYYPNAKYVKSIELIEKWPNVSINPQPYEISMISEKGFTSLNEFILNGKERGLTHLIIDNEEQRPEFLKDVLENESEYPFLEKIYDSKEHGFQYNLKIFRINYQK